MSRLWQYVSHTGTPTGMDEGATLGQGWRAGSASISRLRAGKRKSGGTYTRLHKYFTFIMTSIYTCTYQST